jgi:hypothetical protein
MIAHVAEAAEARGRVVLHLRTTNPNFLAIEAAVRVAQAFQSGIETLFVEDMNLFDMANFSFAREISLTGRKSRPISSDEIEQELRLAFASLQRRIEALARAAEVPIRQRVVRDEPIAALAATCAECGPWNVVALAEPFATLSSEALRHIFEAVADATGLVLVGPKAKRTTGPVIVAVEDLERLPSMIRAGERLAAVTGGALVILPIADDEDRLHWMEGEVRLLLGDRKDAQIIAPASARGAAEVVAGVLRRLHGGFVISQFGGLVVPGDGDLRALAAGLECPLLLVR